MRTRRTFLTNTAAVCSIGSATPLFWRRAALASGAKGDGRILIVVELTGGNDGLNTVVPHGDDAYVRSRPTLAIKPSATLKLDDRVGLNDALKPLLEHWDRGDLAVVQQVGYPEPNRSHAEAMSIWQGGSTAAASVTGWLGRAADVDPGLTGRHVGPNGVPLGLLGRRATAQSIYDPSDFRLEPGAAPGVEGGSPDPLLDLVRARHRSALELAAKLESLPAGDPPSPEDPFPARMDAIRRMIIADASTRVYYTSLEGFDTHAGQAYAHRRLLGSLGKGVGSLLAGLREHRLDDRVAVLIFSEFGRRLKENASAGTDHGAAGPVLLVGPGVKGGLHGPHPDLQRLDSSGDPLFGVDFRDVYASVLGGWLGVDPTPIVGRPPGTSALFG